MPRLQALRPSEASYFTLGAKWVPPKGCEQSAMIAVLSIISLAAVRRLEGWGKASRAGRLAEGLEQ